MPFLHLISSAPISPVNYLSNPLLYRIFYYSEMCYFASNMTQSNNYKSIVRSTIFSPLSLSISTRSNPFRALLLTANVGETLDSWDNQILSMAVELDSRNDSLEGLENVDDKEQERRRKIGLANKGRVPWNKGRKHSAETCERIKQRTREALRDPKVRKKMSEHPRSQSDRVKDKISSSLRRVWKERLKWKSSSKKFLLSWAESIAMEAKKGRKEQKELDWDSYDNIKQEMAVQQLQWVVEKAKAKEMAKERAENRAKIKAENREKDVSIRKERARKCYRKSKEQKRGPNERGDILSKSKEDGKEVTVARRLKLKQRLAKIRKKKSINGKIDKSIFHTTAWEKLNLELLKNETLSQKEVSLADLIQIIKSRKAEPEPGKVLSQ